MKSTAGPACGGVRMRRREFMKKFVAIPLVAVMLAALAVPVLAEGNSATATESTQPTPITIQGKYDGEKGTATVFSVDIKWGSMRAIYSPNRTSIWNPNDLSETEITSGSNPWRWEEKKSSDSLQTNEIAITNRSNIPITCSFAFQSDGEFSNSGIGASVTTPATGSTTEEPNSFGIRTALEVPGDTTDKKLENLTRSGFVTLTGELSQSVTEFKTIGTISVTITEM